MNGTLQYVGYIAVLFKKTKTKCQSNEACGKDVCEMSSLPGWNQYDPPALIHYGPSGVDARPSVWGNNEEQHDSNRDEEEEGEEGQNWGGDSTVYGKIIQYY